MTLKHQALEIARMLRDRAEDSMYGYPHSDDPHDFTPDPECATAEEIERHRLATEAWDRGEALSHEPPITRWKTEAEAKARVADCMKRGALAASIYRPGRGGERAGDKTQSDRLHMSPTTIAALYVETDGVYFGLPDVDPWDVERDARKYAGPHPVVAHPPCKRWGRYWHGGPSAKVRRKMGDDGGCFVAAIEAVDRWGGVLEHPEASHAWNAFGVRRPPRQGGWVPAGLYRPGWTCCVEQGHYGHRARKATWLYAVGCELPELVWGPSASRVRLDVGFHSAEERALVTHGHRIYIDTPPNQNDYDRKAKRAFLAFKAKQTGKDPCAPERLNARERMATPLPFRDLLLGMARSAQGTDTPRSESASW